MLSVSILWLLVAVVTGAFLDNQQDDNVVHMEQRDHDISTPPSGCGKMVENYRFDCYPEGSSTQAECEARGCCWNPEGQQKVSPGKTVGVGRDIKAPWCYFPVDYPSYVISQYEKTKLGYKLLLSRDQPSPWPNDIMELQMDVTYEVRQRLHFKIYDPKNARYEVPIDIPPPPVHPDEGLQIEFFSKPFGFIVGGGIGASGPIMDTSLIGAPLIFSDQFIQMSARIPSDYIYGLGEHKDRLLINASTGWQQRAFWARDQYPTFENNLYGVHPFYMGVLPSGEVNSAVSFGVLLLNSNAMEFDLQPMPALTFRTTGGVLDFYVFYGFSPDEVIQQYTSLIGFPHLPPYWALGFHLCRYGYNSSKRLKEIIDRNRAIGIPYDVQWTDIDYMDAHKDWTYDHKAYEGLPDIVTDLHQNDQKYVIIVDPGILVTSNYTPYDEGMKMDIFIKNSTGQPIIGKVWPGDTVFPDFTHPQAQEWWYNQAKAFHDQLPYDGLWTDMNEPSNFVLGSKYGCTNNNLDKPPYTPGIDGGNLAAVQSIVPSYQQDYSIRACIDGGNLAADTICPSSKQHLSSHYNLHSLYGHFEVKASKFVLEKIKQKRSFVISRSTFVGTGQYGGHWSGDITSSWEDLEYSIPEMLRFQMFGIPMVGADICGFGGVTTEELCTRWMQLGAFYPFMRNHNTLGSKDQDPGAFSPTAQHTMRVALQTRYAMLPLLYTLFVNSHLKGSTVARPYFFVYPSDPETYAIDKQFFWGDTLLISPVLTQGATTVRAYFNPNDTFYDGYDGSPMKGGWQTIDAPLDKINIHVRGGSIIPYQQPEITTVKTRMNPFGLCIALGVKRVPHFVPKPRPHQVYVNVTFAKGELYWDDGESLDSITAMKFNHIEFSATKNNLTVNPIIKGYDAPNKMMLNEIRVMGLVTVPTKVMFNKKPMNVTITTIKQEVMFSGFQTSLTEDLLVTWS